MKIKLHRLYNPLFRDGTQKYTTIGFWYFDKPLNKGTLHLEVLMMRDWRHELAVWCHEIFEVAYCWFMGITTEECDRWDDWVEKEYEAGRIGPEVEGGSIKGCPYRVGHLGGIAMEYLVIYGTFAGWKRYEKECNEILGIG